jgi:hypothetical protein
VVGVALIAAVACPAQPAVLERERAGVVRTTVVACDGDRRLVARRARLVGGRSGTRAVDVWGAGRYVAWAELRYARGRPAARVRVGRIARGRVRVVDERVVLRRSQWRWRSTPAVDVVVTTRGEFAWLANDGVLTARVGERARGVSRGGDSPFVLEDDRTLRWWNDDPFAYYDLRPWGGAGCPQRRRFRVLAASDRVRVSMAQYVDEADITSSVVRACVDGEDRVIAQDEFSPYRVGGFDGEWVVLALRVSSRSGCEWIGIEVYDARSGRAGRPGRLPSCDDREPTLGMPLVVTTSGAPAWIVSRAGVSALYTTVGDGVIELDSGGLAGLVADGTVIRWVHDGQPRSMDLG